MAASLAPLRGVASRALHAHVRRACAQPVWRSSWRSELSAPGAAPTGARGRALGAARASSSSAVAVPTAGGTATPATAVDATHPLARLEARNLLKAVTSRAVWAHLDSSSSRRTIYSGVDPSASSLHLGNLLPLLALYHLREAGLNVIVLVGGATGSIGDPSGRSTERNALEPHELQHNVERITAQIHAFYARLDEWSAAAKSERSAADGGAARRGELHVCNNQEWYAGVGVLDFLRDTGKYMRLGNMLAKESVRSRMQPTAEGGEAAGLSFTEFSYQLLQAYDFLVLHRDRHCTLQLGGSDQLGNIVAGIELILRLRSTSSSNGESGTRETEQQQPAYGLTLPLLTTASGQKFGKSAGNAVWLDADMTSDFDLYQHLLRSADADVATYLRSLTLLPLEKVEEVLQRHAAEPGKRTAQKTLADEMVGMLRGASALRRAQTMSALLFERHAAPLPASDVFEAFQHDARLVRLDAEALGAPLARLAADIGAAASRGEARRLQKSGGLYLNGVAMTDASRVLESSDFSGEADGHGAYALLRVGKTEHRVLWLASSSSSSSP